MSTFDLHKDKDLKYIGNIHLNTGYIIIGEAEKLFKFFDDLKTKPNSENELLYYILQNPNIIHKYNILLIDFINHHGIINLYVKRNTNGFDKNIFFIFNDMDTHNIELNIAYPNQIDLKDDILLVGDINMLLGLIQKYNKYYPQNYLDYLNDYTKDVKKYGLYYKKNIMSVLPLDNLSNKGQLSLHINKNNFTNNHIVNPKNYMTGGAIGDFGGFNGLGVEHIPTFYSSTSSSLI